MSQYQAKGQSISEQSVAVIRNSRSIRYARKYIMIALKGLAMSVNCAFALPYFFAWIQECLDYKCWLTIDV